MPNDFSIKELEQAFLAGIEFQIYNQGGTDIEGWKDEFKEFLKRLASDA